jgi:HEAT repeat protein
MSRVFPAFPEEIAVMLRDRSPSVRWAAAREAVTYSGAAVDSLREVLSTGDPDASVPALYALASMGGATRRAWPEIYRAFTNEEAPERVRGAAAAAMWRADLFGRHIAATFKAIYPAHVRRGPDELCQLALRSIGSFLDAPRFEVPRLAEVVDHESSHVRLEAVRALTERAESFPDAAAALAQALRDPDDQVRALAARAAWKKTRLEALGGDDPAVRALAAEWLEPDDETLPALLRALEDPHPDVRAAAADALSPPEKLGWTMPEEVVRALIDRFADASDRVAKEAVLSLHLHREESLPLLIEALDHPRPGTRRWAARTLCEIREKALPARDRLEAAMRDEDPLVRAEAANAFAAVADELEAPIAVLTDTLRLEDRGLRLAVCRMLDETIWRWSDRERFMEAARPLGRALLRLVLGEDEELSAAASSALDEKSLDRGPECERALWVKWCVDTLEAPGGYGGMPGAMGSSTTTAAGTGTPWVAARDLGRLGAKEEEAVAALRRAAAEGDPILKDWAEDSLRRIGADPPLQVDELVRALESADYKVRWRAVKDLAERGKAATAAVPALTRRLEDEKRFVRAAAEAALARIRGDR